jgi:hypothetical protein
VNVADGYARNYLLPRKMALLATAGNKKVIEREKVKFDAKEAEEQGVGAGESPIGSPTSRSRSREESADTDALSGP